MRKTVGTVLAVVLVIVGVKFGIIGGLLGAAAAGLSLKYVGVVSPDSAWVSETKWVTIAKYVLLAVVLLGLAWFAYVALGQ